MGEGSRNCDGEDGRGGIADRIDARHSGGRGSGDVGDVAAEDVIRAG